MVHKPYVLGLKTEAYNPKMILQICEGISCSSFSVKELDVIVHKIFSVYNPIELLAILHPPY